MQSIRRGGFTAAAALAAALGAWLAPREALAGSATEKRDLHPPIGAAADATTPATGNVEGRENRRGRTLDVKVRNLAPRRAYEVRSLGDDRTLTTFTTNRRGRGTAKYRDEAPAPAPRAGGQALEVSFNFDFEFNFEFNFDGGTGDGSGDGTGIDWTDPSNWPDGSDWIDPGTDPDACGFDWYCVQILDAETGECVLTCDGDEHDGCGDPVEYRFESGFDVYCGDDGEFAYATMSRT